MMFEGTTRTDEGKIDNRENSDIFLLMYISCMEIKVIIKLGLIK